MRKYIFSIIVLFSLISCEKNAGEGGTSVIEGRILYFTIAIIPFLRVTRKKIVLE